MDRKTKRKISLKTQKNKTWKAFSTYIRTRDCIKTTNSLEYGRCCTCGKVKQFSELDAGHFISGRGNAILFDEKGVNAQCVHCNRFREGMKDEYFVFMENEYGRDTIDRMMKLKHLPRKYSQLELEALEKFYKNATKKLQEKFNENMDNLKKVKS